MGNRYEIAEKTACLANLSTGSLITKKMDVATYGS